MDLIGFIYGFGFLHGMILAGVLLLSQSGNRRANAFMAALITCIAIRFLDNWLIRIGVFMHCPQWSLLSTPLDFAWGPLLYLYSYTMADRPLGLKHLAHFAPCVLLFSAPITFMLYPREQQLEFLNYFWSNRANLNLASDVLSGIPAFWRTWVDLHLHGAFFSIQFGIYSYLVLRQIHHHNLKLEQHFSFTDQMNLRWLRILTYICALFLALFLAFNRARLVLFGHFEIVELGPNTPFLFLVLGIYVIGIMALKQPRIEQRNTDTIASDPGLASERKPGSEGGPSATPADTTVKYIRSGVSFDDAQRYKIRLMEAMQDHELYLDSDLTLRDLAEHANLTYQQASEVINGQMNQRFFSFVNSYRVKLAKQRLADPKTSKMPIVELALEVGFKSRSSFYDAFKKVTQMTPTQFKNSLSQMD